LSKISDILVDDSRVMNFIHYNTREMDTLSDQLCRIIESVQEKSNLNNNFFHMIHGFQLNTAWPDPLQLKMFRTKMPEKKIVLQINNGCFKSVQHSPKLLVEKLHQYYFGLFDYILLDASGGRGTEINIEELYPYILALWAYKKDRVRFEIGIAGGI